MKSTKPEILVFWVRKATTCSACNEELSPGSMIHLRDGKATCLSCADLDHLSFLPRGNVALTTRSSKYSTLRAIVLQWSRSRKRYERQGILVEQAALERAEQECLSDAARREAQRVRAAQYRETRDQEFISDFARLVRERYPGCPEGLELEIAEHACLKYSGRVGRSAMARNLDPEAVDLAVRAHVRHLRTDYDTLLMAGWDRNDARARVAQAVTSVLERWAAGLPDSDRPAER